MSGLHNAYSTTSTRLTGREPRRVSLRNGSLGHSKEPRPTWLYVLGGWQARHPFARETKVGTTGFLDRRLADHIDRRHLHVADGEYFFVAPLGILTKSQGFDTERRVHRILKACFEQHSHQNEWYLGEPAAVAELVRLALMAFADDSAEKAS